MKPDSSWSRLGDCWRKTRCANEKRVGELKGCHLSTKEKGFGGTWVVKPDYLGRKMGEEVGLTELASKICPLASCPCRRPTRFTKYPVRVVSNLKPTINDQSTVESPNGTNYSAKDTRYYSTDSAPYRACKEPSRYYFVIRALGPNQKLRELTLSPC